ncbi:MAG TPA: TlpA disulfide reductase family protein [Thermoanaerobaculia bacterium]|nr:TlpA disulfide reductase family protein [Thermoanaerobaculia bacterium]
MRRSAVDFGLGALAFGLTAASVLLQSVSMRAVETSVVVLPVILFPLATTLRAGGGNRWLTFIALNLWCVVAYVWLAWIANAGIGQVVLPMTATLACSAISAVAPRRVSAGIIVAAGAAMFFATPSVWNAMLTRHVDVPAPRIELTTSGGVRVPLSQLRGNVVVLNFWGVWCGPCVRELPELEAASRNTRARYFAVNSALGGETAEQIDAFLRVRNVTIPVAYDFDRRVYKAFAIRALPTTVIIDPRGMIRVERAGFVSAANYERWLQRNVAAIAGS